MSSYPNINATARFSPPKPLNNDSDDSRIGSGSTSPADAALYPLHHWGEEDDSDLVFPRGRYYDDQGMTLKTPTGTVSTSAYTAAPTLFTASWSWLDSVYPNRTGTNNATGQAGTTPQKKQQTHPNGRTTRQGVQVMSSVDSVSSSGIITDTSSTSSTLSGILGHLESRKSETKVSAYNSPTQELSRFFSSVPVGTQKEIAPQASQQWPTMPIVEPKSRHIRRGSRSASKAPTHASQNLTNGLRQVGSLLDETGELQPEIPTCITTSNASLLRGSLKQPRVLGVGNPGQKHRMAPMGAMLVNPGRNQQQYAQLAIAQPNRRSMRRGRGNGDAGDQEESTNLVDEFGFPDPTRTESYSQSSSSSRGGGEIEAFPGWTWTDEEESVLSKGGRYCRRVVGALVILAVMALASTVVIFFTHIQGKQQRMSTSTTTVTTSANATTFVTPPKWTPATTSSNTTNLTPKLTPVVVP